MTGMHIDIIAVGRLKERFWVDACAEYLKRLGRYAQVTVTEVNDQDMRFAGNSDLVLKAEGQLLEKRIPLDGYSIMLDRAGVQLESVELAELIVKLQSNGISRLAFVIGGSWGIDAPLKERADRMISLGAITLPHNLCRVVLLEQLYRCFRIIQGEPYHK